jgi:serine/threonine-protein kinase
MSSVAGGAESSGAIAAAMPATSPASRYRPLVLLGHGGMGSVEAVAEELDDGATRVVALKRILRSATADPARLEMFLREARLTTLLDHPNVVRSFAWGESAGEVFLAMEYVAGEPLSQLVAAARQRGEVLPPELIAFIVAEACEGLHAAHELRGPDGGLLGVVHRDVSPHNVMVGFDGSVKLLDFGVAKINLVDCAARTKTGEVKGKTAYMSPEQAMGDSVDRRSDLYSVGALLFECLTGQRMWGTGTDFDVLRRLALEDAPRLAEVLPGVAPGLATLHAELIERDPAKRPGTAHDVAVRLRECAAASASGARARGDAAAVRATMARYFDAERRRREEEIAEALSSSEPLPLGSRVPVGPQPRLGPGESAPAFVTHHGAAAAGSGRRSGLVAVAAAIAAILGATFGFAYRSPRLGPEPRATAVESHKAEQPSSSADPTPAMTARPTTPDPEARRPVRTPETATPAETSAESAPTPAAKPPPGPVIRRLATPRTVTVAPSSSPPQSAAAQPKTAPAPPTSAAPKPPEPPDVDPTPF